MAFDLTPEVDVYRDADGQVTQLRHVRRRYSAAEARVASATPAGVAAQYVREVAGIYGIEADEISSLEQPMPSGPVSETVKLRQVEEKNIIDTTTVVKFQQTALGLSVWNSNIAVVVAGETPEVVSSSSTLHHGINLVGMPSIDRLTSYGQAPPPSSLRQAIGVDDSSGEGFALNGVRLLVYRYDPAERVDPEARPVDSRGNRPPDGRGGPPGASAGQADAGYNPANPRPTLSSGTSPGASAGQADAGYDPANPRPTPPGGTSPGSSSGQADAGYDPANPRPAQSGANAPDSGFLPPADTSPSPLGGSSPAPSSGQAEAGYDPARPRLTQSGAGTPDVAGAPSQDQPPETGMALQQGPPTLPLPPVPGWIVPGRHYVVKEVLFRLAVPGYPELNWRAFVEPESSAVLYLRALTACATCAIYETDPIAKSGAALTAASPDNDLNNARTLNVPMHNLDGTVGGSQHLSGTRARVQDLAPPPTLPPTTTAPFNFEYNAKHADFAATNAYYHSDWMFRLVAGMGFNLADYFNGTSFPVPVDHTGMGTSVNAQAPGNATGDGLGRFLFGLCQSGQTMGIATQVGVCLHEFGHALLWDHVDSPNFGWCHSAGDTLAALYMDPDSKAHLPAGVPNRFVTFPFLAECNPGLDRRHDRDVAVGWAWGGTRDDRQYGSETILSTTMFRVYRMTGGDDADVNVRKFASRYLMYLIVKAIGTLTATTTDPRVFVTALQDADDTTTIFEGHAGGAWHKVIRWSFERQGLFQPPGAPTPVTQPGAPPNVDVFIDDGRNGQYQPYLTNIGASPGVWNRQAADSGTANQQPATGVTNYLYVRVNNRGLLSAAGVSVRCYQGAPGSALQWPTNWTPLTTPSMPGPAIPSGGSAVIGPFHWTPTQPGAISVLASASATGDASNADTVNGPISNRRLVPNDNNVAQRDFTVTGAVVGIRIKIASGSTTPGTTNWQPYAGTSGIYLDVDTSAGKFTSTPRYFTTLGGNSSHWSTTGANAIYNATPTGFRVYVRWSDGAALTPAQANSFQWHINWIGIEE
jgi:hypothetical protein